MTSNTDISALSSFLPKILIGHKLQEDRKQVMANHKTTRDFGLRVGHLEPGPSNLITDVTGVKVGHTTLSEGDVQTGVTAILPHEGNIFQEKLLAATHVINGFGKSMGLIQINELGTLETPIILTNTLSIGTAANALIEYMLNNNPDIGSTTGTVNPVVGECNDGFLNDIRGLHVTKEHVWQAIDSASDKFAQGAVGAGTGMCAYELKGGIGSASRVLSLNKIPYTVGIMVLANMGRTRDLLVAGQQVGQRIAERQAAVKDPVPDGSIIVILATDIPLCERQLGRIAKRALIGLARTGSQIDSGSGEIVIAFSTANRINHYEDSAIDRIQRLNEERLNDVFRAVAECTEEAILNSMLMATTASGIGGHVAYSLAEYFQELVILPRLQ